MIYKHHKISPVSADSQNSMKGNFDKIVVTAPSIHGTQLTQFQVNKYKRQSKQIADHMTVVIMIHFHILDRARSNYSKRLDPMCLHLFTHWTLKKI